MNAFALPLTLTAALLGIVLSGCNRYQVTVNERLVHTPPALFTDYDVSDPGLATCLNQTIKDRQISAANQLTLLNCANGTITSLDGIQVFSALKTINLSNNALSDIKPLLYLGNLESVSLEANPNLQCKDALALAQQLRGTVRLPEHCR